MSGSPKQSEFESAAQTARQEKNSMYDIGTGAMGKQFDLINQGLAEGEPGYMKDAFQTQRTGLVEGALSQGGPRAAGGVGKGNTGLSPASMGASLANALYTSKLHEGLGNIEQINKLMAGGLGLGATAGSASLGAAGNQLQAASMMQNYDPTYAKVLGGLNLGGSIYGGFMNQGQGAASRWTSGEGGYNPNQPPNWQGFSGNIGT